MDPLTIGFIIISFIISIYVNFIRSYWSRKGIPTPSSFDIKRFTLPIHLHDQEIYRKYGNIVGLYEGLRPTLMIGDPNLIKDILTKDYHNFPNHRAFNFGHSTSRLGFFFMKGSQEKWEKLRSIMMPSLTTGKMRILSPKINDCIHNLLVNIENSIKSEGPVVNLMKFFKAFSLDVVSSTAFGISIDSLNEPDNPIVSNAKKFFSKKPAARLIFEIYLAFSWIKKLKPTDFDSLNFFSKLTERITREKRFLRKKKYSGGLINGKNLDFIQMFLDVIDYGRESFPDSIEEEESDAESNSSSCDALNHNNNSSTIHSNLHNQSHHEPNKLRAGPDSITLYGHDTCHEQPSTPLINGSYDSKNGDAKSPFFKNQKRKSISLDELKAQGILFFMAGYAGTATLLSNVTYLLAIHREVQEKLISEIDSWKSSSPADLSLNYDVVSTFKFLDAIVWETLRLHPPVARVERECVADYHLAKTDITVPSGMTISIPVYAIHRDPNHFDDPDSFIPERFLPTESGESPLKHSWAFLPFGGGESCSAGVITIAKRDVM